MWTLVFLDEAKLMSNKLFSVWSHLCFHSLVCAESCLFPSLRSSCASWSWLCVWTSMLEKGVRPQRQCAKIPSLGKTLHPSLDFVVKSFGGNFGTTCWFRFEVQVLHLEMTIAWWSYSLRFGSPSWCCVSVKWRWRRGDSISSKKTQYNAILCNTVQYYMVYFVSFLRQRFFFNCPNPLACFDWASAIIRRVTRCHVSH